MRKTPDELVSVKVPKPFLTWLKVEAAKKSVPMYVLLEGLVFPGKAKPWRSA
jgi:hypothetical protein